MRTSSKHNTDLLPLRSITVFSKQGSTEPRSVVRAHALASIVINGFNSSFKPNSRAILTWCPLCSCLREFTNAKKLQLQLVNVAHVFSMFPDIKEEKVNIDFNRNISRKTPEKGNLIAKGE